MANKRSGGDLLTRLEFWAKLLAQDGYCFLCQNLFDGFDRISIDHVVSKYQGGSDDPTNLVLAHARCNFHKSNRSPTWDELHRLEHHNLRYRDWLDLDVPEVVAAIDQLHQTHPNIDTRKRVVPKLRYRTAYTRIGTKDHTVNSTKCHPCKVFWYTTQNDPCPRCGQPGIPEKPKPGLDKRLAA